MRAIEARLARLERADEPADAVARIVFGDAEPLTGNGPIIRVTWDPAFKPSSRWLTTDSGFNREEFAAVCDEVEQRLGGTVLSGQRDPKMGEFSDAQLAAIALGDDR